jgi:hypothetical protein
VGGDARLAGKVVEQLQVRGREGLAGGTGRKEQLAENSAFPSDTQDNQF